MAELDDRKRDLRRQLEQARSRMAANRRELSVDLDVPARLKTNIAGHRGIWLTAAALIGLVVSKIPPRTKKVVIETGGKRKKEIEEIGGFGLVLAGLKFLFGVLRPLIMAWVSREAGARLGGSRSSLEPRY